MKQKPEKLTQLDASALQTTEVTGTLARFRFRNPDTGFAVVRFDPDGGGRPLSAVGQLAQLAEGQKVKIIGKLGVHPRFGPQLEVEAAEAITPSSAEGIQAYLSSSLVRGIGPEIAARIVTRFGADTLRIIDEAPERLAEINGLGRKRIDELVSSIRAQRDVQDVMVFLRTHGLGQGLAARIVKRYGRGASALIQANPYRLVDEVIGIGFRTADQLATKLGIDAGAPERLQAGLLHTLAEAARDGHCFLPAERLASDAAELLGCELPAAADQIPALEAENRVVVDRVRQVDQPPARHVYPLALHQAEAGTAALIDRLLCTPVPPLPIHTERALQWFAVQYGMQLPDAQQRAIARALEQPVSVITGGPGVGKTTIIRALAEILGSKNLSLRLAAPTGRAAKRLEESTGRGAQTIHRLLEYQGGVHRFTKNEQDPLEGDVLVVDETSMLDVALAYSLFRAVPPSMRLVLVGDIDQLPAVGPGSVLADIIASGRAPVTALREIFRQQRDSHIVRSAHGLLRGEMPESGPEGSDFFFIEARSSTHARELIRELVLRRIPSAFGLDSIRDVQVLCPMYRGEAGADAINDDLQDLLNPSGIETERAGHRYRVGDKVMQIRNDYDLDVFNGDTGRVVEVDRGAARLRVRFAHKLVEYSFADLDQLVPAYAITVHRAQGSEYPAVVMPVVTDHYMMLRRSLLYTAITRGKRLVVLVGSSRALRMAVDNRLEVTRNTGLARRLHDAATA